MPTRWFEDLPKLNSQACGDTNYVPAATPGNLRRFTCPARIRRSLATEQTHSAAQCRNRDFHFDLPAQRNIRKPTSLGAVRAIHFSLGNPLPPVHFEEGDSAFSQGTETPAPQTPAPSLLVTPSAATLLVGEPAAFSAVDDSGRPLTDVHWSLDPPLAELHVENGEITLGLRTHSHGRQSVCHRHHRYRRRRQASRRHGALVAPALAGLRNSVRSPIRSRTFRSRVLLRGMEKIRERRRPRLTNLWPTALDDSALLLPINRHGLLSSSRTSNGRFPRYHWPKWLA